MMPTSSTMEIVAPRTDMLLNRSRARAYTACMQPNDRLSELEARPPRLPASGRRDQIVAEAAALFADRGYHGTSMQDIAERVGMLKGSLYAHVANKEEILLEIVSTAARLFTDAVRPVMLRADAPAATLRDALSAHMEVIAGSRAEATVFLFEWRHLEGQPLRWFREARERYEAMWDTLVRAAQGAGVLPGTVEPRTVVRLILSAAAGACHWALESAESEATPIAEALADLLLHHAAE
ncbi:MAG: TetR/AcrR family transcriptional regulator [Chloroflexota bacterium]